MAKLKRKSFVNKKYQNNQIEMKRIIKSPEEIAFDKKLDEALEDPSFIKELNNREKMLKILDAKEPELLEPFELETDDMSYFINNKQKKFEKTIRRK